MKTLKVGQVYSRTSSVNLKLYYHLIIEDYGKLRPLNIGGPYSFSTNMGHSVCPYKSENPTTIYSNDVLIAETFEDFLKMPIAGDIFKVKNEILG